MGRSLPEPPGPPGGNNHDPCQHPSPIFIPRKPPPHSCNASHSTRRHDIQPHVEKARKPRGKKKKKTRLKRVTIRWSHRIRNAPERRTRRTCRPPFRLPLAWRHGIILYLLARPRNGNMGHGAWVSKSTNEASPDDRAAPLWMNPGASARFLGTIRRGLSRPVRYSNYTSILPQELGQVRMESWSHGVYHGPTSPAYYVVGNPKSTPRTR